MQVRHPADKATGRPEIGSDKDGAKGLRLLGKFAGQGDHAQAD
jgi:hypothetical protein